MEEVIVSVTDVSKVFEIPHERHTSLKSMVLSSWRNRGYRKFEAIEKVDFEIYRGEFFGIIGQNGSGKSTLLKILAGIYMPTRGKVRIDGRLSPFIELGVGFNPELTARENVFLNGAILGLSRADVAEQFDEIISFAELEEFVDQKLKNFSSGMLVRLAFSVAIRASADILLIDEVLAVGDANFQQKCFDVFRRLKAEGKTIIFVSHDLASIKEFSDRVLLLNKGKTYGIFTPGVAIAKYSELNQERTNKELEKQGNVVEREEHADLPHVKTVELLNSVGEKTRAISRDEPLRVRLTVANPKERPIAVGVAVYRIADNLYCFGTNTSVDDVELKPQEVMTVDIEYPRFPLQRGTYDLTVGVFDPTMQKIYETTEHILDFQAVQDDGAEGVTFIEHTWQQQEQVR
jgi:ABC-type polysaccharide/polyol phosphate transport system ATPase subunit